MLAQQRHRRRPRPRSSAPARTWSCSTPMAGSATFTDPSYHLPAFYELFALYGPAADSRQVAIAGRHQPQLPGHLGPRDDRPAPRLRDLPGRADDGGGRRRSQRVPLRRLARGDEHGGRLRLVQLGSADDEDAGREVPRVLRQPRSATGNVTACLFHRRRQQRSGGGSTALTATLAAGALASARGQPRQPSSTTSGSCSQQSGSTATTRRPSTCSACSRPPASTTTPGRRRRPTPPPVADSRGSRYGDWERRDPAFARRAGASRDRRCD